MKRVFIVSEFTAPENSTGFVWSKVIDRLSEEYECTVISPGQLDEPSRCAKERLTWRCFAQPTYDKNKLLSRLLGQLKLTCRFALELRRCAKKGDIVLSGTNPTLLLTIVPLLKRLIGVHWILLMHDVFPDNLGPAAVLSGDSLRMRLLKRYFDFVYSCFERTIVIGRDMSDLLTAKLGSGERVRFIPNWAPTDEIAPVPREHAFYLKQQGWQTKTVFQFFGNMGRLQGIPNLLEAISLVTSSKAAFLFIGDGAHRCMVENFIRSSPSKNVAWIGSVPMNKKNEGLAACDVALVTLEKGMAGLGVPSKAYFSMAADKPLLAVMEPHAEIARLVRDEGIGWSCDADSPRSLARLIDSICASETGPMAQINKSPRSVLQQSYEEEGVLNRFADVVRELQEDENRGGHSRGRVDR